MPVPSPTDRPAPPADGLAAPADQPVARPDQPAAPADGLAAPADRPAAPAARLAVLAERLVGLVDGGTPRVEFGRLTLDLPAASWVAAATAARDDPETDLSCFDWLSAVDELDEGFSVLCHLYSTRRKHSLLILGTSRSHGVQGKAGSIGACADAAADLR